MSILENEDASAAIFIEPKNGGCTSEQDSADKGNRGLIDNLSGSQLNAPAEALLSGGRRIKICQTDPK